MRRSALTAALIAAPLLAGDPQVLQLRTTLRAETLRLPGDESLGLVGLSSTADFGLFYLGPGLYGAARGERGGLFTFGLEGGMRGRPFDGVPLEFDAGLFVGGGGGAAAPQGGGLMLRPHAGVALALGRFRLGAELSRVRFPSGGIDSTQAAFSVAFTTDHLWSPMGALDGSFDGSVRWEGRGFEGEALKVDPAPGIHSRGGALQAPFDLAGFAISRELRSPFFRYFAVDGAARGGSSGYAQALTGLGLRAPIAGPLGLEARLGAGLGGGGDVDTGGGFLVSGEAALTLGIGGWRASAGLGSLRATGGQLRSRTVTLRIAHRLSVPTPWKDGEALAAFTLADWRAGSGLLVYRRAQRQDGTAGAIQVMTLRADRMLAHGFYLSGEAGSATGGGAGGYSTGLAGLGWQTPAIAAQRFFLEASAGAGGGGGLRSGGGLLTSTRAGWRVELPLGLGLDATAGKVRAPRGGLDTTTYGLGLHLRFAALER
ncbi:MAG TPA: hypothetical protein VNV60_07490 [Holophagaceae bacterium]|nr:hypothetical protein [Holophagaceae bacterium]